MAFLRVLGTSSLIRAAYVALLVLKRVDMSAITGMVAKEWLYLACSSDVTGTHRSTAARVTAK